MGPLDFGGILLHGGLHAQGGIAGPYRMVFMGQGRPKEGHYAVAHHLVDGALIAMHRGHHAFQHGIKQLAGLLRITVGQQFHGAFEVGEEHRDLLAFAFERTAGGEDFLREIGRGVGEGWRAGGATAASPIQTSTSPSSSPASRCPLMSSSRRSSSASSSRSN